MFVYIAKKTVTTSAGNYSVEVGNTKVTSIAMQLYDITELVLWWTRILTITISQQNNIITLYEG